MGRFDISPEVAEEYRAKFRDAVSPHLDEDVLAVGTFRTTGSGQKFAISKLQAGAAGLRRGGEAGQARARAGFRARSCWRSRRPSCTRFKYKMKRNGVEVKEEVAAWDRAGLKVGLEQLATTTRVKLEWPDGRQDRLRPGRHGGQPLGGRRRPRASDGSGRPSRSCSRRAGTSCSPDGPGAPTSGAGTARRRGGRSSSCSRSRSCSGTRVSATSASRRARGSGRSPPASPRPGWRRAPCTRRSLA